MKLNVVFAVDAKDVDAILTVERNRNISAVMFSLICIGNTIKVDCVGFCVCVIVTNGTFAHVEYSGATGALMTIVPVDPPSVIPPEP